MVIEWGTWHVEWAMWSKEQGKYALSLQSIGACTQTGWWSLLTQLCKCSNPVACTWCSSPTHPQRSACMHTMVELHLSSTRVVYVFALATTETAHCIQTREVQRLLSFFKGHGELSGDAVCVKLWIALPVQQVSISSQGTWQAAQRMQAGVPQVFELMVCATVCVHGRVLTAVVGACRCACCRIEQLLSDSSGTTQPNHCGQPNLSSSSSGV